MAFTGATTTNIKLKQATAGDTGYTSDFNNNLQLIDAALNGPGLTITSIGSTYYCTPNVDNTTLELSSSAATATIRIKSGFSVSKLGIGTTAFDVSANNVICIGNGTAPSSAPSDVVHLYAKDAAGATGKSTLHITAESGTEQLIVAAIIYKTTTGNPTQTHEGLICINTYDNNVKIYADGNWRTIASGW